MIQAATLVEQLARTGDMNLAEAEPLIKALFVQTLINSKMFTATLKGF